MAENKDKEYWQITRYYKDGSDSSVLKYTYEDALKKYYDTLKSMSARNSDKLVLYRISDGFVNLWFTTIIG